MYRSQIKQYDIVVVVVIVRGGSRILEWEGGSGRQYFLMREGSHTWHTLIITVDPDIGVCSELPIIAKCCLQLSPKN